MYTNNILVAEVATSISKYQRYPVISSAGRRLWSGMMFRSLFMVHAYMHHFFLSSLFLYPVGCQILKAWVPQQGVGHQPAITGLLPLYNRLVTDRTWYAESSQS